MEIATTGQWGVKKFGLTGGGGPNFNHAKIGVSISGNAHYSIFGDMNQQGAISEKCSSSQNGRGGLFFVLDDPDLFVSITSLVRGTRRRIKRHNLRLGNIAARRRRLKFGAGLVAGIIAGM